MQRLIEAGFAGVVNREFTVSQVWSRDGILGHLHSTSRFSLSALGASRDRFEAAVLDALGPDEARRFPQDVSCGYTIGWKGGSDAASSPSGGTTFPQHRAYAPDFGADLVAEDRRPREPRTPGAIGGSCLCGAVVFEFDGPPLRMYNCHCSRCRRAVSAGYQTVVRARLGGFRWLAGPEKITGYRMPGTRFECAFCTVCGSRTPWERGEQVCVPAGCLDNDPAKKPSDNIFTVSRAAWTVLDERLETWREAPAWSRSSHFAANHIVIHSPSVQ